MSEWRLDQETTKQQAWGSYIDHQRGRRGGKSFLQEGLLQMEGIKKKNKSKGTDRWTFPLAHPSMFCASEVVPCVNRERPLGFLKIKNAVMMFVYHSITAKAALLRLPFPMDIAMELVAKDVNGVCIYRIEPGGIQKIIKWTKQVHNAPWGENAERMEAEVFFPEI